MSRMDLLIAVRLPESDRHDLETLLISGGWDSNSIATSRPFDGESVVQAIVALSATSYPFFRTWLTTRASTRKSFAFVHNGTELKGYTPSEAAKILEILDREQERAQSDGDSSADA